MNNVAIREVRPTPRPIITIAGANKPLVGANLMRGDTHRLNIRYRAVSGLTDATLKFTAKSVIDNPDADAEVAKSSPAGIVVDTTGSTDSLLIAQIVLQPADTNTIPIPADIAPAKLKLYFDLQLTLTGGDVRTIVGPVHDAHFFLVSDVTQV